MAGHSKWAQIKHKKGITDAKKGKVFSKISRLITVAARGGDGNPDTNSKLRLAIERARAVNMPRDVIDRAIARAGNKNEASLEEFLYEAYGPEGSAFLIEGITDNKNRSTQEIKHLVADSGGKFATPGTVLWLFDKKGICEISVSKNPEHTRDNIELIAIDAGAESIEEDDDILFVVMPQNELRLFIEKCNTRSLSIDDSYTAYIPKNTLSVSSESWGAILNLINALESHDDVQKVYTNADLSS